MKVPVWKIQQIVNKLTDLIEEAENRNVDKVETSCNTYGLDEFVSFGSAGYLDLNAEPEDLFEDEY